MFDQLKKTFGRVFSGASDDIVSKAFANAAPDDRSLPQDIAQFVATGEPSGVLGRIQKIPNVAEKVALLGHRHGKHTDQGALIAALSDWPAQQLLRLAQVYFAATKAPSSQNMVRQCLTIWNGGYEWLEVFIRHVSYSPWNVWGGKKEPVTVRLSAIEEMIALNEQDPTQLARAAVVLDTSHWGYGVFKPIFEAFPDLKEMLERQQSVVREGFRHADFRVRVHTLELLAISKADPLIWRDEIAAFAVAPSKQVRQAAETLVRSGPEEFRPLLEAFAREGENETRSLAIQSLHRVYDHKVRDFLEQRRAEEKAKKVVETLDDILRVAAPQSNEPILDNWGLPAVAPVKKEASLEPAVREAIRDCVRQAYAAAEKAYERIRDKPWAGKLEAKCDNAIADSVYARLQNDSDDGVRIPEWRAWRDGTKHLLEFPKHPSFTLIHVVRWCRIWIPNSNQRFWFSWCNPAFAAYAKTHGMPALRDVAAVFDALGMESNAIAKAYLEQSSSYYFGRCVLFQQQGDRIWPYFAERLDLLETALVNAPVPSSSDYMAQYDQRNWRTNALEVLSQFPRTPKRLIPALWEIALKGPKSERLAAQAALAHENDVIERLVANLSNGQMEVRAEAAAWLGRLGAKQCKEPLLVALKKEKKEIPQSAMMLALESFGVPPTQLVDRAALEKEAVKQSAKDLPADLSWFPFTTMPPLRWADNESTVMPDLVLSLIVQAFKIKNPEPGPLLRAYANAFRAADRAKLARFILEAWIAQDTIPAYTSDEAAKAAEARTQQSAQFYAQHPQYAANWNEQQHYRAVYNSLIEACKGSAISSKGILAVAGAFGTGELAPIVHRYIKKYYGLRGAQSKALLQMLAWIDDSNAIQVLLATGNRFRTKGIQEEASRLCQELAERKNWTLDELADRTIPTAGLDEDGVLELDFGARTFTAKLTTDFTLSLSNGEGREISSLPDSNKTDDEEKAKIAKAALSSARKELKTVVKLQQERLYEAMCTQREWAFEDFRRFILTHPVVGRFCQQLVWCVVEGGKTSATFRPLPDKTLTNTDDDPVEVADSAKIRLAHEVTVNAELRDAWIAHFADYKVEPLFAQFGKPSYPIDKDKRELTSLTDFEGHVIDSFKLRGKMTKLGYTRGQAQDGGWFSEYHKRFPGLRVQATLNFTGSPLPEENRPVAILNLAFNRIGEEGSVENTSEGVPLGELPPVLLTECWNDVRLAAADGKGFDPNWEKTVKY